MPDPSPSHPAARSPGPDRAGSVTHLGGRTRSIQGPTMTQETRLDELLSLWQQRRRQGKDPAALGAAEFERLCKELHVKQQPWASGPWHVSVTEARAAAARARKPIFLVVNTGNCLGFV